MFAGIAMHRHHNIGVERKYSFDIVSGSPSYIIVIIIRRNKKRSEMFSGLV